MFFFNPLDKHVDVDLKFINVIEPFVASFDVLKLLLCGDLINQRVKPENENTIIRPSA